MSTKKTNKQKNNDSDCHGVIAAIIGIIKREALRIDSYVFIVGGNVSWSHTQEKASVCVRAHTQTAEAATSFTFQCVTQPHLWFRTSLIGNYF